MAADEVLLAAPYAVAIDLTAGTIGGCAGIVVGQPFDTVKVRLQTHSSFYKGAFDCVRQTFRHEGTRGFFKGLTSPLVGNAWTNAIMFGVYERSLRAVDPNPENPTLRSVLLAGMLGGFCQTIAVTPTELIKCRLQVQDGHPSGQVKYRGPMDCVRSIYARRGVQGLFLGYPVTLWREVPSFGVYFLGYEWAKRSMLASGVNEHTSMLLAGGFAGVTSWAVSYPVDVVKSSIQVVSDDAKAIERTMAFQTRKLYQLGGWRVFVNGLGTTLVRAFPVNAVTFYMYETSSDLLKGLARE